MNKIMLLTVNLLINWFFVATLLEHNCYARKIKHVNDMGDKHGPFHRMAHTLDEDENESNETLDCKSDCKSDPTAKKIIFHPCKKHIVKGLDVSFDWTQTTTSNLERAVDYFLEVIPEEQNELRSGLKQKSTRTKEKIKHAKQVGDPNYREAEFLSFKLAMVANWHKAAQTSLMRALQEKEEAVGGIRYKLFEQAKKNAQREMLYEIYAALDGCFPDPDKPVDHTQLTEIVYRITDDVFAELLSKQKDKQAVDTTPDKDSAASDATAPMPEAKAGANKPDKAVEEAAARKNYEAEKLNLEIAAAKCKKDLETAQNTLEASRREQEKIREENQKLKVSLELERQKRVEEDIRRKIEEKRLQDAQNKLEKEKAGLENKLNDLAAKKATLENKINSLEDNLHQQTVNKTLSDIELEKVKKQKEAAEQKLDQKKAEISQLQTRIQENERRQLELQISKAKEERARKAVEQKNAAQKEKPEVRQPQAPIAPLILPAPTPLPAQAPAPEENKLTDAKIKERAHNLDNLNDQQIDATKDSLQFATSLFEEFNK